MEHICRLYVFSQQPCWCERLSRENPQGRSELLALRPSHLADTPLAFIKGEDAVLQLNRWIEKTLGFKCDAHVLYVYCLKRYI